MLNETRLSISSAVGCRLTKPGKNHSMRVVVSRYVDDREETMQMLEEDEKLSAMLLKKVVLMEIVRACKGAKT